MDDFTERVKASLEDPDTDPWFPKLTGELTTREWARLGREIGVTPKNYGTARMIAGTVTAPRYIITTLNLAGVTEEIEIERLAGEYATRYKNNVRFYSRGEILNTSILPCLKDALAIVNHVPSLMKSVIALVRSLHVIIPQDNVHDVSFSEPQIPFSIFVSVPKIRMPTDSLRVAEAIVHEAMHLQLSLIEQSVRLVGVNDEPYFSPWRNEYRTPRGVLHAIYVFNVIDRFIDRLNHYCSSSDVMTHAFGRRAQIRNQFSEANDFRNSTSLTKAGRELVAKLLKPASLSSG